MKTPDHLFTLVEPIRKAKQEILSYIKDQSIPFGERLRVFIETPEELRTTSRGILHILPFENRYGSLHWYADLDYQMGELIDLRELVSAQENHFLIETWDADKFRAFQESVLSTGIHEFTMQL